ncbi:hypothetical protein E2C01_082528 [Portunus trituberculatus]|uniref:Uncharacterized protein n=1 Tax=Portunus trituberculatus TaxID=210409 RepID=A0A5B7IYP5_PORTR|nr:hypothetical protein [Portunus trituberculatus]
MEANGPPWDSRRSISSPVALVLPTDPQESRRGKPGPDHRPSFSRRFLTAVLDDGCVADALPGGVWRRFTASYIQVSVPARRHEQVLRKSHDINAILLKA